MTLQINSNKKSTPEASDYKEEAGSSSSSSSRKVSFAVRNFFTPSSAAGFPISASSSSSSSSFSSSSSSAPLKNTVSSPPLFTKPEALFKIFKSAFFRSFLQHPLYDRNTWGPIFACAPMEAGVLCEHAPSLTKVDFRPEWNLVQPSMERAGALIHKQQETDPTAALQFFKTCAESMVPGDTLSLKMAKNISDILHKASRCGQLSILEGFQDFPELSSHSPWDLSFAIDLAAGCEVLPANRRLYHFRLRLVQTILEIPNLSPRTYTEALKIAISKRLPVMLEKVLDAMESATHIERFEISGAIAEAVDRGHFKSLNALLQRPLLLRHLDPSDTEIMRATLHKTCRYPEAFALLFDALSTSACKDCCQGMLGVAWAKIYDVCDRMREDRKERLQAVIDARSHLLTQHDRGVIARKRTMELGWGDALSEQDLLRPVLEKIDEILEQNAKLGAEAED